MTNKILKVAILSIITLGYTLYLYFFQNTNIMGIRQWIFLVGLELLIQLIVNIASKNK